MKSLQFWRNVQLRSPVEHPTQILTQHYLICSSAKEYLGHICSTITIQPTVCALCLWQSKAGRFNACDSPGTIWTDLVAWSIMTKVRWINWPHILFETVTHPWLQLQIIKLTKLFRLRNRTLGSDAKTTTCNFWKQHHDTRSTIYRFIT
jgi:hypothetical protein